eukprot:8914869-Pyramimonas_sp.AAC.1
MEVVSVLGTPICTHVPVLLELRGLLARATVTAADGPEGYPLQPPPPARPAPREVADAEWPWAPVSDPRVIQQAAECWFMHAEDYLCQ